MCDTTLPNMALQSLWIRKHMLQSPSSDTSHQERRLSENEKRVLRSIEKLSIPEWYLNNNSRPPKILSNDTPIDQRPAAWKNISTKASPEPETPVVQPNNSTVCPNGVLETKIESSSNAQKIDATEENNRNSPSKKSPVKNKPDGSPGKLRRANISQTFPRLSPSRKITNINIVFPQEMANTKRLMITDLDDLTDTSVNDLTVDSLEVQKEEKGELDDTKTWDSHEEDSPEENISSHEESEDVIIAGSGLQRKSGEAKRRLPVCLFLMKKSRAVEIPKAVKNDSESQKSQVPVRSSDSTKKSAVDDLSGARTSEKENKRQAAPSAKKSAGVKRKLCGCSNAATPARQPPGSGPRVSTFRPKTVLPPIPETEFPSLPEQPKVYLNKCPSRPLLSSTVKSVQPIDIDDADSSSVSQSSLASDIIEEFNQRFSAKAKATYDSPSSKNFVKKLVTALESEVRQGFLKLEELPYEESTREIFFDDETFIFGENSSEDEMNGVATSTSISLKGSDSSSSSGSSPGSPMIMNGDNPVYDWNSASGRNAELPKSDNEYQDDDGWIYWHQNSEWNYPRTSSRLSSVSSQSADRTRPCVSPINEPNDLVEVLSARSRKSSSNGWGTVYRTRKNDGNRMWRLDGTIVLDSGYSDRSNSPPSTHSEETLSFNYTGTTLTASENSSYCHYSPDRSMSPVQPEEQMPRRVLMI